MDKAGQVHDYESVYLRRTYRDGGKVRNETVANLSALPAHVIDWVIAQARTLGLPGLLGPAGRALHRPNPPAWRAAAWVIGASRIR